MQEPPLKTGGGGTIKKAKFKYEKGGGGKSPHPLTIQTKISQVGK